MLHNVDLFFIRILIGFQFKMFFKFENNILCAQKAQQYFIDAELRSMLRSDDSSDSESDVDLMSSSKQVNLYVKRISGGKRLVINV